MAGIIFKVTIGEFYYYGRRQGTLEDALVGLRSMYGLSNRRLYRKIASLDTEAKSGWDEVKAEVVREYTKWENPKRILKELLAGTQSDPKCLNHNGRRK